MKDKDVKTFERFAHQAEDRDSARTIDECDALLRFMSAECDASLVQLPVAVLRRLCMNAMEVAIHRDLLIVRGNEHIEKLQLTLGPVRKSFEKIGEISQKLQTGIK